MATSWSSGVENQGQNQQICDNMPSTSSWPSTELTLETPERNRWRYKKRPSVCQTTPSKLYSVDISPVTPKKSKKDSPLIGKSLTSNTPSPLRRFQVLQCSSSVNISSQKKTDNIQYRIGGNTQRSSPSLTTQLNNSSSLDDSGFSSLGNSSGSIYDPYFLDPYYPALTDDFSTDSFSFDAVFENDTTDFSSIPIVSPVNILPSYQEKFKQVIIDVGKNMEKESQQNDTSKFTNTSLFDNWKFGPPASVDILEQQSTSPVSLSDILQSSKENENVSTMKTDKKMKQKTLEEKILTNLDKLNRVPFDENYAKTVDLTEFRKLKLMSSLSSNFYKTVLGRSKDQIEMTREAHKFLSSKRVSEAGSRMNISIVLFLNNNSAQVLSPHAHATTAAASSGAEDDYYYNSATEAESHPRYLLFSCVMILSAIVTFIQIFATIYCPHLADLPIRWHTLNCSCWNVFQLLIFANCASESSFNKFLKNQFITDNCLDIQRMTLSIFYSSMIMQIPVTLLMHFVPNIASTKFYKFYVWIPIYFFLDLGTFLIYGSTPWSWKAELIPIQVYQAAVTVLNNIGVLILLIGVIGGIIHFIVYWCQYMGRPDSRNSFMFVKLINLLLFVVYTISIVFVHAPANNLNMGTFLTPYVYQYVLPYMDLLINIGLTLIQLNELTSLLVPVVEFVMTWICIPTYRMELLHCFSCGQSLRKPKPIVRAMIPFQSESLAKVAPGVLNAEPPPAAPSYY
uniref:Uncharacterized protein n=1 Tax=Panagrolaimus sp. JU765 TaxID=591449 RepID=A0AC34Q5D0_9BILA